MVLAGATRHSFEVEYARSNMATCRTCMAKIPKGALRIGHTQLDGAATAAAGVREEGSPAREGIASPSAEERRLLAAAAAPRWHHFECFGHAKGARWFAANLPRDATALHGFDALQKSDQARLRAMWKALLARGTGSASPPPAAAGAKRGAAEGLPGTPDAKRRRPASEGRAAALAAATVLDRLSSVQGVLPREDFLRIRDTERELSTATVAQLQAELLKNNQVRTGKKEELVRRVAEGRCLGALPACPQCGKGRLHWSRVGGWFSCPGHFDEEARIQRRCNYRTQNDKRIKWVQ